MKESCSPAAECWFAAVPWSKRGAALEKRDGQWRVCEVGKGACDISACNFLTIFVKLFFKKTKLYVQHILETFEHLENIYL